jgi:hypothetical protein
MFCPFYWSRVQYRWNCSSICGCMVVPFTFLFCFIVIDIEALLVSLPNTSLFVPPCCLCCTTVDVRWLNTKPGWASTSSVFPKRTLVPSLTLSIYFSIRDTVSGTVNCTSQQNITYQLLVYLHTGWDKPVGFHWWDSHTGWTQPGGFGNLPLQCHMQYVPKLSHTL